MEVKLRPAQAVDIPSLARVAEDAFWDHPDNVRWAPARAEYEKDFYRAYRYDIAEWFYSPRSRVTVAYEAGGEGETPRSERIVGFAYWKRKKTATRTIWPSRSLDQYVRYGTSWTKSHLYVYLDRSWGKSFLAKILPDKDKNDVSEEFVGEARMKDWPEMWTLRYICVTPDTQGRRIGSRLVEEGLEIAEADGIAVAVYAHPVVVDFYRKHGFEIVRTDLMAQKAEGHELIRVGKQSNKGKPS